MKKMKQMIGFFLKNFNNSNKSDPRKYVKKEPFNLKGLDVATSSSSSSTQIRPKGIFIFIYSIYWFIYLLLFFPLSF